ncbi:MAG: UDP-N-acetylmuramate dehydrogenase [Alphaproteobacteria bacterium]|nr:UDP-N-acetylmuramate dehydrogenase [Alphaproteobacteria bacterium]
MIENLPEVRGNYRDNYDLSKVTWFAVGGPAEVLFRPADIADLQHFIQECPSSIPITVIGLASNLLVRDGGIKGIVIRMGREFAQISHQENRITAGAAALTGNVARYAAEQGLSGLEFYVGIPGSVGGALAMNAGAYHQDTASILLEAQAVDPLGNLVRLTPDDIGYVYRGNHLPDGYIFTNATYQCIDDEPASIKDRMNRIMQQREASQPVRAKTGGSTFKNPQEKSAWKLIDEAGCRGLRIGGAHMSEKHCNFMINDQHASAADIETLAETIRKKVHEHSGILLEWEIKRIGER